MNIYHAHGRDHKNEPFSFVVRAGNEDNARMLVHEVLVEIPIIFNCTEVGLSFQGETDESIIW